MGMKGTRQPVCRLSGILGAGKDIPSRRVEVAGVGLGSEANRGVS